MRPLVVLEIPGLSRSMAEAHAPHIAALGALGTLAPEFPALTLPAHASIATGLPASSHGMVANGWFYRDHNEVMMWRQGEGLVQGEKVWEAGKKQHPEFTCLKHFWWPGMGSTADISTNVRPAYFADGRKSGDVYANQPGLAQALTDRFGKFPLFKFWGPGAGIESSTWIAASGAWMVETFKPTLSLIYLPHLDYKQQTHGPNHPSIPEEIQALDTVVGELMAKVRAQGADVMVLSSYTMNAVSRPIHINRTLREAGHLRVIKNATGELIDFGMSEAFAVSDHQIAHVYVKQNKEALRTLLENLPGVASVVEGRHPNDGDFIVSADTDAWFTYYYWLDDTSAPDFARSVAIHAKPGYDPCEMLIDPAIRFPKLKIAGKIMRKLIGMRMVMDVIPLDASLIKGSHGLRPTDDAQAPVLTSSRPLSSQTLSMCDLKDEMLRMIFSG